MTGQWSGLIGNRQLYDWFACSIRQGRLGGSFLFVGAPGIGKQTVADLLSLTLMCETSPPSEMSPCGHCGPCVQVIAGTHPDVIRVAKPADKTFIPLDLLIGRPEVRMQEGFCRDVRLKPFHGSRKVAILHDADYLNEEGANCLLKTLEEPPADAVIILIGTSEQRQLPTIRSRCQIIRFRPLSSPDAVALIRKIHEVDAGEQAIAEAVDATGGDIHAAVRQLSGESDSLRQALHSQLSSPVPRSRWRSSESSPSTSTKWARMPASDVMRCATCFQSPSSTIAGNYEGMRRIRSWHQIHFRVWIVRFERFAKSTAVPINQR